MRYFKVVMICFAFIFFVIGATAGVLYLLGKFEKEVIQPEDIAFEVENVLTDDDFLATINTTTENVTEKIVTLSLTNQTEKDGYITDGVITIPKTVKLGKEFTVKVNKTRYDGMEEDWNVGGSSIIRAKSSNPLIQEAIPMKVDVDVPVKSVSVELYSLSGTKLGTVATSSNSGLLRTLSADSDVVELAVGSVINLKAKFLPEKSKYNTNGELKNVIFEIPTAWKGIHIDFYGDSNDQIQIMRQTTIEDIRINCYCFRKSQDEYSADAENYSQEELISLMNSTGVSGESSKLFGTNQRIDNFSSSTNDGLLTLDINKPVTLYANNPNATENEYDLGLSISSDAGDATLADKIAIIKLFAYRFDGENWVDAGTKLVVEGVKLSTRAGNGISSKINRSDVNLSSWKVVASETGTYKLSIKLEYEYYSSNSTTPEVIRFNVDYETITVNDPISSDVAWNSTLPVIQTLTILDGETQADKYFPTIMLPNFVKIQNPNATYKVVKYFAYTTDEEVDLRNVINCSLYASNFEVPDSSTAYSVYEIPDGILTVKNIGSFRIFFATVISDYLGNVAINNDMYSFESFSNTNTINVVKSLKSLSSSIVVNDTGVEGKVYNQNTDEATKDYIFHVRQQDEDVFTLSLFVNDMDIFERDYADGKILIKFFINGIQTNILTVSNSYVISEDRTQVDFLVTVGSLPDSAEPVITCRVEYLLDSRLSGNVQNEINGVKHQVEIKVLNGFAQSITFDVIKDASPANTLNNPIQVSIDFNAGADNVATSVVYSIIFNEQELEISELANITINEEALNKAYTLTSNKPAIIAVVDGTDGGNPTLSILGSTTDELVTITATAADGSGISANLYFSVEASSQIVFTPDESEIVLEGYQGNQVNFRSYFTALAGEIDLVNLLNFEIIIADLTLLNSNKIQFEGDVLEIKSTFGKDASVQLYITTDFGLTKIIPIRISSDISYVSSYALSDSGLNDSDFIARGESVPTERGTRVYAENNKEIGFVLSQISSGNAVSVDLNDFILTSGVYATYTSGILTLKFDPVSKMEEKTIVFKKGFVGEGVDSYGFTFTMKFLVFPNIESGYYDTSTNPFGGENNPVIYTSGETILFDANDYSNGVISLSRIVGEELISENVVVEMKFGSVWQALASTAGVIAFPTSLSVTKGSSVQVRMIYEGYILPEITIYLDPFFDYLPELSVTYDGMKYVPFIADGTTIDLQAGEGVTYSIIRSSNETWVRINNNLQIERVDRKYLRIITTEKLRITNSNGYRELPIIILPIDYPFANYDELPDTKEEITQDLKYIIEQMYDVVESDEEIDLNEKIAYAGETKTITLRNADESEKKYVEYDAESGIITTSAVGTDKMIYIEVKCGSEFEDAFTFVYRFKIVANQNIEVFYPYIQYTEDEEEEYDISGAYEYLYFDGAAQISIDLLESFSPMSCPNYAAVAEKYGPEYARRFVVTKVSDEDKIAMSYKDLHFEVASVGVGQTVIPSAQVSNYAIINETRDETTNALIGANIRIMKGLAVESVFITIKAYTDSGAVAYYRFKAAAESVSYKTYYDNTLITADDFSFASNGGTEVNLVERVVVKLNQNPEQTLASSGYDFHMIIIEENDEDFSQFISISEGVITVNSLVSDIQTTIIVYNATGEISHFTLILKATLDHDVRVSSINTSNEYVLGENVLFFDATPAENVYDMQEIEATINALDYINGSNGMNQGNFLTELGGYKIVDITAQGYRQYVMIDNMKRYASDLFNDYNGAIGEKEFAINFNNANDNYYITYNGSIIYLEKETEESYQIEIPIASTSSNNYVVFEFGVDEIEGENKSIKLPTLRFSAVGADTRDFILYTQENNNANEEPAKLEDLDELYNSCLNVNGELDNDKWIAGYQKIINNLYVQVYVNGEWTRYHVVVDSSRKYITKILYVSYNNQTLFAKIDADNSNHEYVEINGDFHYFTRFYSISYHGLALSTNEQGLESWENIPQFRYTIPKKAVLNANEEDDVVTLDEEGNLLVDLSKIMFVNYQGEQKALEDKVTVGTRADVSVGSLFVFYNSDETVELANEESHYVYKHSLNGEPLKAGNNEIQIVVKDKTRNYVVGRAVIILTVETSTYYKENNENITLEAGHEDVNYFVKNNISYATWTSAMKSSDDVLYDISNKTQDSEGYNWTAVEEKLLINGENANVENGIHFDGDNNITTMGSNLWGIGELTTEAYLTFIKTNANLFTEIEYADWKFGDFENQEYSSLLGEGIIFKAYNNTNNNSELTIDATGKVTNVPYGASVSIVAGRNCSDDGSFVPFGRTYLHLNEEPTIISDTLALIRTTFELTEEEFEPYLQECFVNGGILELDESEYPISGARLVVVDEEGNQSNLIYEEGSYQLQAGHTINAYAYERKSPSLDVSWAVEIQQEEEETEAISVMFVGEGDPVVYNEVPFDTWKIGTGLGSYLTYAEVEGDNWSISINDGTFNIDADGKLSYDGSEIIEFVYKRMVEVEIKTLSDYLRSPLDISKLNLNESTGYEKFAQAVYGANLILGLSWTELNAETAEYTILCNNLVDGEFGNGIITSLDITITKNTPEFFASFYLVNQETENSLVHYDGNIEKICEPDEENNLVPVVNPFGEGLAVPENGFVEIEDKLFLPVFTDKKINISTDTIKNAAEKIILSGNSYLQDENQISLFDASYYTIDNVKNEGFLDLFTGKEGEGTDLNKSYINSFGVRQNGYLIGMINIYLSDFGEDPSNFVEEDAKYYLKTHSKDVTTSGNGTYTCEIEDEDGSLIFDVFVDGTQEVLLSLSEKTSENQTAKLLFEKVVMTSYDYVSEDTTIKHYMYMLTDGTTIAFLPGATPRIRLQKIEKNSSNNLDIIIPVNNSENHTHSISEGITQDMMTYDKIGDYFVWEKDYEKTSSGDLEKGTQIYKAEKIAYDGMDSKAEPVFKDQIIGGDSVYTFNYDNWKYNIYYYDENGQKIENEDKNIDSLQIEDDINSASPNLYVEISDITNRANEQMEGTYKFEIPLITSGAFSINSSVSNGADPTSIDTPINGITLASGQVGEITFESIFKSAVQERVMNDECRIDGKSISSLIKEAKGIDSIEELTTKVNNNIFYGTELKYSIDEYTEQEGERIALTTETKDISPTEIESSTKQYCTIGSYAIINNFELKNENGNRVYVSTDAKEYTQSGTGSCYFTENTVDIYLYVNINKLDSELIQYIVTKYMYEKGWFSYLSVAMDLGDGTNKYYSFEIQTNSENGKQVYVKVGTSKFLLRKVISTDTLGEGEEETGFRVQEVLEDSMLNDQAIMCKVELSDRFTFGLLATTIISTPDPIEDPVEDPVEDPIEDPIEDPVEDPIEDPVEDPIEDPVEDPIEDPVGDSTTDMFTIIAVPKFDYNYEVVVNANGLNQLESKTNDANTAWVVKGGSVAATTKSKIKFTVSRAGEEKAYAYYLITINPSVEVMVNYPAIKSWDDEITTLTSEKIYIEDYKSDYKFDINSYAVMDYRAYDADPLTQTQSRLTVYRNFYNNDYKLVLQNALNLSSGQEVSGELIALSDQTTQTITGNITVLSDSIKITHGGQDYIFPYLAEQDIEYAYSCIYPEFVKSEISSETGKQTGRYYFDASAEGISASVGEIEVVFSVKVGGVVFGEYRVVVCKSTVVGIISNVSEQNFDEDGAEIIPISGGDNLTVFKGNVAFSAGNNGAADLPRLTFTYDGFELNQCYYIGESKPITINNADVGGYEVLSNVAEGPNIIEFKCQSSVIGYYKYKTVWDYAVNMSDYTVDGVEGDNVYYNVSAGQSLDVVTMFGLTDYAGEEFTKMVSVEKTGNEIFNSLLDIETDASGKQMIHLLGAPNGGARGSFKLTFFGIVGCDKVVYINLLPAITYSIEANYNNPTTYGLDENTYEAIAYSEGERRITFVNSGIHNYVKVFKDGVLSSANLTYELVESNLGAEEESIVANEVWDGTTTTLTYSLPESYPKLDAKYLVFKVSDTYGYVGYVRFVLEANTQVVVINDSVEYSTGDTIDWEYQAFPLAFSNKDVEVSSQYMLTSVYEYNGNKLSGYTNINDGVAGSSLYTATTNKLRGVQLNSIIEATNSSSNIDYFIPFRDGDKIPYSLYRGIALRGGETIGDVSLYRNFSTLKIGDDGLPTSLSGVTGSTGELSVEDGKSYEFVLKRSATDTGVKFSFTAIKVESTGKLYFKTQTGGSFYQFDYSFKVNGVEFVGENNLLEDKGNAQYGAGMSYSSSLIITVKDSAGEAIDDVEVNMTLFFKTYIRVRQLSNVEGNMVDYVREGEGITTTLSSKIGSDTDKQITFFNQGTAQNGSPDSYCSVLGDTTTSFDDDTFVRYSTPTYKMNSNYVVVNSVTITNNTNDRKIELSKALPNEGSCVINNVKYTLNGTTLTIGYRENTLVDNKYYDPITNVEYRIDGGNLIISKLLNNSNKATINNKTYRISKEDDDTYVTITTNYESVYIVYNVSGQLYWAEWKYIVSSKFVEIDAINTEYLTSDGITSYLIWKDEIKAASFDPNTMVLSDGVKKYEFERNGDRFEAIDGDVTYTLSISEGIMTFGATNGVNALSSLSLIEDKTSNSAWMQRVYLSDANGVSRPISLEDLNNLAIKYVGSGEIIENGEIGDSSGLNGKVVTISIDCSTVYKVVEGTTPTDISINGTKQETVGDKTVSVQLKRNGENLKIAFESYSF